MITKCSYFILSTQNIKFYWFVMKIKKFMLPIWWYNRGLFPLRNNFLGVFVLNGLNVHCANCFVSTVHVQNNAGETAMDVANRFAQLACVNLLKGDDSGRYTWEKRNVLCHDSHTHPYNFMHTLYLFLRCALNPMDARLFLRTPKYPNWQPITMKGQEVHLCNWQLGFWECLH